MSGASYGIPLCLALAIHAAVLLPGGGERSSPEPPARRGQRLAIQLRPAPLPEAMAPQPLPEHVTPRRPENARSGDPTRADQPDPAPEVPSAASLGDPPEAAAAEAPVQAALATASEAAPASPGSHADLLREDLIKPTYPTLSRRRGEEGVVGVRVAVDADGRVEAIEVARSSGHRRLDQAARDAVREASRHSEFVSSALGDAGLPSHETIDIVFRLEGTHR